MKPLRPIFCLPGLLVLGLLAAPVQAQYQWRDANGRMVFSDQPPPASVAPGQIIRSEPLRPVPPPADAARAGAGKASNAPAESASDKALDARRKTLEQGDAEKKKREEAERKAKIAKACDDIRGEVRTLEAGMRTSRVNEQGEREWLNDAERARRLDSVRKDLKEHCN